MKRKKALQFGLVQQKLCSCRGRISFVEDKPSGLWVCAECGLPRAEYYLALRSAQPPLFLPTPAKGSTREERVRNN